VIEPAGGVVTERVEPDGRVEAADSVANERLITQKRVAECQAASLSASCLWGGESAKQAKANSVITGSLFIIVFMCFVLSLFVRGIAQRGFRKNFLVCANEPSLAVTLQKEGQVLRGRRPTDLARARLCTPRTDGVNTIFANRRFQFHKRGQLFSLTHNERFSVAAMRISNPDCPAPVNTCNAGWRRLGLSSLPLAADKLPTWASQ